MPAMAARNSRLPLASRPEHLLSGGMLHVVKAREGRRRDSFGVPFDVLATGPQSMMTQMHYQPHHVIPFHRHPNEQIGYLLRGRIRVLTRGSSAELAAGDTYVIPADVEHSIEILEPAEEIQVFTPPREAWR